MYREVIEHPEWIPEHIQKYFDLRSGMDRGRIYRIIGRPIPGKKIDLTQATTAELSRELGNTNGWWRSTAQRLLVERADPASKSMLESILRESKYPFARLHALGIGNTGSCAATTSGKARRVAPAGASIDPLTTVCWTWW